MKIDFSVVAKLTTDRQWLVWTYFQKWITQELTDNPFPGIDDYIVELESIMYDHTRFWEIRYKLYGRSHPRYGYSELDNDCKYIYEKDLKGFRP